MDARSSTRKFTSDGSFAAHPPDNRYISSGEFQPTNSSPWAMRQLLGWRIGLRVRIPACHDPACMSTQPGCSAPAYGSNHRAARYRVVCMVPRAVHMGHPSGGDAAAPSMMRRTAMDQQAKTTQDQRSSKTGDYWHPTYVVCKQSMRQWPVQRTARRDRRPLKTRDHPRPGTTGTPRM